MSVEALLPEAIESAAGPDAAERQDTFGPGLARKHAGLFAASTDHGFAARLHHAGADEEAAAVQQLEILVRTAIFKPATELVSFLLPQAIDRIDAGYQAKPGEPYKGRQGLEVQCLFGSFAIARDCCYHPRREVGHFPANAGLGLEGGYTPALARLMCLEGADEPGFDKAERHHLAETGGIRVSARQIQRVVQLVGSSAQAWQEREGALGTTAAPVLYVSGDGTGIPISCRSSPTGGGVGAVVDKNHRLHGISRLRHWPRQTFPFGQGDASGVAQADLPLVALWLVHPVVQRLTKTN